MDPVHLIPIQSFSHLWLLRLILSDLHVCVSLFSRSLSSQRSCWKHLFRSEVAISSSTNNRLVLSLLLLKLVVLLRLVVPLVVLQKLCRVYLTDSIQTNWPMAIELGCNPGGWLHAGSALLPPPSLPPSSNDAGNRFVSQPMLRCQLIKVDWALPVRLYFDWYDRFIPVPETGSQLLGVVVWLAVDATVALTRTLIRSVLVCWWMETRPDLIAPETFIKTISLFLSLSLSLRCLSSDWFISSANADLSPPGSFMHSGVKRRHHLHIVAYSNEWWSTARSDEAPPAPLPENPEESPMPLPAPRRIFQAIGNQPLKLD